MSNSGKSVLVISNEKDPLVNELSLQLPEYTIGGNDQSDEIELFRLVVVLRETPCQKIAQMIDHGLVVWAPYNLKFVSFIHDVLPENPSPGFLITKIRNFFESLNGFVFDPKLAINLVNKISNAIVLCNANGKLVWTNKGFEQVYGYTREEFIQKNTDSIYNFSVHQDIATIIDKLKSGNETIKYITQITTKKGTKKWLQSTLTPIYEGPDLKYIAVIEADITELKNARRLLETQGTSVKALTSDLQDINHELEAQRNELDQKHKELLEEKERSDALLHNILPEIVAHQLKKGKKKPKRHKAVTVMFADFKGFSKISKEMSPLDVVSTLDELFCKFDEIVEKHFIEKIKTIGDAYMCAGGLPMKNNSHYVNVVMAALEIQQFLFEFNKPRMINKEVTWECRIGIHSGEVFAGVVGQRKFAYDIWGDTVNVAARMETNGAVNSVNISEGTYGFVKDYFDCIPRGEIEAKNIGRVNMYFVTGLKPEYAKDATGVGPNEEFQRILRSL